MEDGAGGEHHLVLAGREDPHAPDVPGQGVQFGGQRIGVVVGLGEGVAAGEHQGLA